MFRGYPLDFDSGLMHEPTGILESENDKSSQQRSRRSPSLLFITAGWITTISHRLTRCVDFRGRKYSCEMNHRTATPVHWEGICDVVEVQPLPMR